MNKGGDEGKGEWRRRREKQKEKTGKGGGRRKEGVKRRRRCRYGVQLCQMGKRPFRAHPQIAQPIP